MLPGTDCKGETLVYRTARGAECETQNFLPPSGELHAQVLRNSLDSRCDEADAGHAATLQKKAHEAKSKTRDQMKQENEHRVNRGMLCVVGTRLSRNLLFLFDKAGIETGINAMTAIATPTKTVSAP